MSVPSITTTNTEGVKINIGQNLLDRLNNISEEMADLLKVQKNSIMGLIKISHGYGEIDHKELMRHSKEQEQMAEKMIDIRFNIDSVIKQEFDISNRLKRLDELNDLIALRMDSIKHANMYFEYESAHMTKLDNLLGKIKNIDAKELMDFLLGVSVRSNNFIDQKESSSILSIWNELNIKGKISEMSIKSLTDNLKSLKIVMQGNLNNLKVDIENNNYSLNNIPNNPSITAEKDLVEYLHRTSFATPVKLFVEKDINTDFILHLFSQLQECVSMDEDKKIKYLGSAKKSLLERKLSLKEDVTKLYNNNDDNIMKAIIDYNKVKDVVEKLEDVDNLTCAKVFEVTNKLTNELSSYYHGNLFKSDKEFDLGISENCYFKIKNNELNVEFYTNKGHFTLKSDGMLVHYSGYPTSPEIIIPDNLKKVTVDSNGLVRGSTTEGDVTLGQIETYIFYNYTHRKWNYLI